MRRHAQERNRGLLVNYPAQDKQPAEGVTPQTQLQQDFTAELGRVSNSAEFRSSENLKRLLSYLGEKWLTGETEVLKEYTIGVEAFGKPSHYDPQSDPAVRVLASKLRHKLEEYYLKEGAKNPFQLSMPRGHYALEFSAVAEESAAPATAGLESRVRAWRWAAAGFAALSVLLAALMVYQGMGTKQHAATTVQPWTPELELIWGPFLKGDRATVISLGIPLFAKFDWGFARNPAINDEAQLGQAPEIQLLSRQFGGTYAVPSHPYTGTGEAMGAFLLAQLLQGRVVDLVLQKGDTLTWDDVHQHNVIFVGAPKLNPLLNEIPMEEGFVLTHGAIRNMKPQPGEPEVYRDTWAPNHVDLLEDYALITRMRGLHESGEIMRLGASSTEATWAAVEYATRPVYAKELVNKVGLRNGALPDRYQVVVHVKFKKLVPFEITYATHRVLQ